MAKAIVIDPGFSVADGDGPELAKDSDGLYARFKDWQEVIISIRFPGAMSHRWEAIDDSR